MRVPGAFDSAIDTIGKINALTRRYPRRMDRVITATAVSRQNLGTLDQICDAVLSTGACQR